MRGQERGPKSLTVQGPEEGPVGVGDDDKSSSALVREVRLERRGRGEEGRGEGGGLIQMGVRQRWVLWPYRVSLSLS